MFHKILNLLRWGRITRAGSDAGAFAVQQTEYLGKVADTLMVFPYGIHGNVPADALALLLSIQGNSDNRAAIAWTPKDRPQLAEGEVAFYHPPSGGLAVWRNSGNLEIVTGSDVSIQCANLTAGASAAATITAPAITLTGNVIVTGTLAVTGALTQGGVDVGKDHKHAQGNDSGGSTEQDTTGVIP